MKNILLFIVFITIPQYIFAQITLKGTVTSKADKTNISGTTVYVSELNKGAITDKNGNYQISVSGKGNFTLQFSNIGYQTKIVEINLHGTDTTFNTELENETIEVNEVVISGAFTTSQNESSQETDVIKKSEMAQIGASTVMDVISKVPGVSAITTGPLVSRPVIRGLSGNRILTVADGVRFETQQWDNEHGIGINEMGMDRIEIIKGPASLLYGPEAMGGVVHFIEESPAAVGHISGEVNGSCMSNNLGFAAGGNVKGANEKYNWSIDLLGKMLPDYYFDGYNFRAPNTRLNEVGGRGSVGLNRKWGSTTLSYKFNQAYYGILDGKDIVKNANGTLKNKDTAEVDMFPSEIEAPYHSVMDKKISSQTNLLVGASRLKFTLGFQNNHRTEYEDNGTKEGYNYVDMNLQSATYDIKWYLPTWNHFSTILGIQGMYETNENLTEAKTVLVPNATIDDIGFVALTKYNLKKFNITGGIRYDSRNLSTEKAIRDTSVNMQAITRSYNNLSGSVGATYDIENHLLLRANYGTGYRTPNLNELMSNGVKLESRQFEQGNINFVKEQNNETDLSAIFKSKHITIEVSAFMNSIDNFIYLTPTSDSVLSNLTVGGKVPKYEYKQANAELKGAEIGVDLHPEILEWVHLELKAENLEGTRKNSDSHLPMIPADKIYCNLHFKFNKLWHFDKVLARIGTITALDQNNVAPNEMITPGYTIINASFACTQKIWKLNNIDFVLAANNILDKQYYDNMSRLRSYGIYSPGRNIVLSIRVPFDVMK